MLAYNPKDLRTRILEMAYAGSTVHIACAFSIVEILSTLYRDFLRYPENDPNGKSRDFLVLSKGHGVMAQYACMLEKNWLEQSDLDSYFSDGSKLTGLADSRISGIESTTGSLGHGASVAVGLALGAKIRGTDQRTFAIVGDGEINEGPIWEAALFASQHKLHNFTLIVDENGLQAMGQTSEILNLGSIATKFESFGFEARSVDGHNIDEITSALDHLLASAINRPKVLVCKTVKGKGVSFMESNNAWHYTRLTPDLFKDAMHEITGVFE
jgi:transketolase